MTPEIPIQECQTVVKQAYDDMNRAWNSVRHAQETMLRHGVPRLIVESLDEARIGATRTQAWPKVVEALASLESGGFGIIFESADDLLEP